MAHCFLLVLSVTTAMAVFPSALAAVQLWHYTRHAPRGQSRSEWEGDA